MIFIDTNYFLRFLLEDHTGQHAVVKALFRQGAEGKANVCTSLVVWFEVYWVLSSFYGKQKDELVRILGSMFKLEFIHFEGRAILAEALHIFAAHAISLEDAYNLTYAKALGVSDFKTFDRKLEKIVATYLRIG